ncbi:hypothetical protein CJD36_001895 [Flavipsychrobacter stenotrophus]|uniref:Uncharacterized protein n=1 Tax=Flavipsychrobacter stenotrophus TaxID=2077091 RepID=A0A2S7T193_9BACT|nr:T9SS type A sorting domain-containing protein [Flavipsychrobacter stenotrophus]PQJ12526.1 hypothetical protein CJD36_001895 [Flavipsychrobacter stenotrophus]
MRNILITIGVILNGFLLVAPAIAQSGTYTIIMGNGTTDIPNISGPATASGIGYGGTQIAIDQNRNIFVGDNFKRVISKVDTSGNIARVIGDGNDNPWHLGYQATTSSMREAEGIAIDRLGNIFIADFNHRMVLKIDTTGLLTNVSIGGFMPCPSSVFVDSANNLYFTDWWSSVVEKITPTGIITIIAGTGTQGFSGDGGPATNAMLHGPQDVTMDRNGNIYIADGSNNRIRKIDANGIITTVAGNGAASHAGDGLPATFAGLDNPARLDLDPFGNLYISSGFGNCHRKIDCAGIVSSPSFISGLNDLAIDNSGNFYFKVGSYIKKFTPSPTPSFNLNLHHTCGGPLLNISSPVFDSTLRVVSYFNDGTNDTCRFSQGIFAVGSYVSINHTYASAGTYTIKNMIINGSAIVDSFVASYVHQPCGVINLQTYSDLNSNCVFDSGIDVAAHLPVTIEVDSNGIPNDTISITGGLYYTANGTAGDIYSFKVISHPPGLTPSCPASGIISDTFSVTGDNSKTIRMGFNCSSLPGFDISVNSAHKAGRHTLQFDVAINNAYCSPTASDLVINISPKYDYYSASPVPASISGHTLTWHLGGMSSSYASTIINLRCEVPGALLLPGDTAQTTIKVIPPPGDLDTGNNTIFIVDTVKSSFDPNYIAVSPQGNILAGTKLQYTIEFENDGNDTAQNIYVMDTLSDKVDPSSFEMVMATNPMNIATYKSGGHTIVKFDFPNIKLLDSTHHNQCTGMLIYNINAKRGLPNNTSILNHAGIFFDDNPVVMTNTIQNVIRIPYISIAETALVCPGDTAHFIATSPDIVNTYYKWFVNSAATGSGRSELISAAVNAGNTVNCKLWDSAGDSLLSISNNLTVSSLALPDAGTITGTSTVCELATTTLSNTATGGTWTSSTASATIATGTLTGLTAGTTIVSYAVTNTCGTAIDTMMVTVRPLPQAGTITGTPIVCELSSITLTDTTAGGTWTSGTSNVTIVAGVVNGISAGNAIIYYAVTNSCGTATDTMMVTINPLPNAGTITGTPVVCALAATTLSNVVTGGAWSSSSSSATIVGGVVTGATVGSAIISYSKTNSCGTAVDTMMVTVNPLPDAGTITGTPVVCQLAATTLSNITSGGTWTSNSPAATVASGVVTGAGAGNAIISYAVTNSCGTATDTMMVTINPLPNAGTITGTPVICALAATTLGNTVTGGTWASSAATATVVGGTVTGITAGNTIISYSVSNSCGTTTDTMMVTVNPLPDAGTITGATAVCETATMTLSDLITGGSWASSTFYATVAGGLVTGVLAGNTIISYSVTNSCGTAVDTMMIAVYPLANAGTITGTPIVCELGTTTLSNAATGGTWLSSSSSATIAGGVVHGVNAGTTIISYSVSNSCNVAVDTMSVTINPLPNAGTINGLSSVCVGGIITLTDIVTGGFWSAGSFDATVVSGMVTGLTANNVDIYYFVTNSCGTAIDTMAITVLPLADAGSITGASSVCAGAATSLASAITGGTWISSTSSTATINVSGIVSGIAAGTTIISYIVTNTCGADTATASITVNALPDAGTITGMDSVCEGMTISLSNTTTGSWSSSNAGIATISATGVVTGVNSGIVTIVYTSITSCGTDTATHQLFVRPFSSCEASIGNSGSVASNLTLYPNPNNGTFTLSGSLLSIGSELNIEIMNMLGQVVYRNIIANTNGSINEQIQPGGKLADGTYILKVNVSNAQEILHFIIKS